MDLTIITPTGRKLEVVINDFTPINDEKELTEVGLALLETKQAKMLRHTLEYLSITVRLGTDYLLILNKPKKLLHNPKQDTLYLEY